MVRKETLVGRYHVKQTGRECIYDSEKLRTLIEHGYTDQEVADEIGCSKQNVAYTRRKMGLFYRLGSGGIPAIDYYKVQELYSQFKTDIEIADVLGCSEGSVRKWRLKNGLLCRCKQIGS